MKYEHLTKVNVIAAVTFVVMLAAIVVLGMLGAPATVVAIPALGLGFTIAGWIGCLTTIGYGLGKRA